MAKYKFTTGLSSKGIKDVIKQLENYRSELDKKLDKFIKLLADSGVRIAQNEIVDFDAMFTHDLLTSIHTEKGKREKDVSCYFVVADSEHAYFVELGTGIKGATGTIYQGNLTANYMSGSTIHLTENGKYGWFYKDDYGNWYFTEGMESRPFMFNTSNQLISLVEKAAKEVFG